MYERIKTQGFKYKRGYNLRNDLAGVTHGLGCGAPKRAIQKEANHSLLLFDGAYKN